LTKIIVSLYIVMTI